MRFILKIINNQIFLLSIAFAWITINVFYLPFAIWTLGLVRPWFIQNGLVPYKDFTWIRTPFDIFALANWYEIFGTTEQAYQFFVYTLIILITLAVLILSKLLFKKKYFLSFLFYVIFLFPLYLNTEEGEILIGLLFTISLYTTLLFLNTNKNRFFFLSGLFSGILILTKQYTLPFILAIALIPVANLFLNKNSVIIVSKKFSFFIIGFLFPILTITVYFTLNNAIADFIYYTIFFLLGPYARQQPNLTHGHGLLITLGYIALLIPFILFWKKNKIKPQILILISLGLLTSMFSVLPSFLSYRTFPSFPLASIIAGYNFILIFNKNNQINLFVRIVCIASFLIFIILTNRFFQGYINFIQQNKIAPNQYIRDYGKTEFEISEWIKNNTDQKTTIQSYKNEIIYIQTKKLPKHKYIEFFPYILRPYDKTSNLFIEDPPDIVIYDTSLPIFHKGLDEWPFITYLEKNYDKVKKYEENTYIFRIKK